MHIPRGHLDSRELREPAVGNLPCGNTVNLLKVNTSLIVDADAWIRYPELSQFLITNNDQAAAAQTYEAVVTNQLLL